MVVTVGVGCYQTAAAVSAPQRRGQSLAPRQELSLCFAGAKWKQKVPSPKTKQFVKRQEEHATPKSVSPPPRHSHGLPQSRTPAGKGERGGGECGRPQAAASPRRPPPSLFPPYSRYARAAEASSRFPEPRCSSSLHTPLLTTHVPPRPASAGQGRNSPQLISIVIQALLVSALPPPWPARGQLGGS